MFKRADPGTQVPPYPRSKKNRTKCPAATEVRNSLRKARWGQGIVTRKAASPLHEFYRHRLAKRFALLAKR